MKKLLVTTLIAASTLVFARNSKTTYRPGSRIQVLAHNAYPDHGKYEDRLDRAIASGMPFVVEQDLAWVDGKSLLIHGKKNVGEDNPTLESYFFPKVAPIVEKALKEGNKGNWPLITLYLDIKNDPPEHLEFINHLLDKYNSWLTTAKKTDDISKQSPLQVKPLMVIVEDKENDIKQKYFYDDIPVGGNIRVFGSVTKPDPNPGHKLPKQEATNRLFLATPQQIVTARADNYHRWWGPDWAYIEKGCQPNAGEWTPEKEKRLKQWVNYGHRMGYFVSFYCLDGYTPDQNQGWDKDYNFGSEDAARQRWEAGIRAKVDFISTDQYEDLNRLIHQSL